MGDLASTGPWPLVLKAYPKSPNLLSSQECIESSTCTIASRTLLMTYSRRWGCPRRLVANLLRRRSKLSERCCQTIHGALCPGSIRDRSPQPLQASHDDTNRRANVRFRISIPQQLIRNRKYRCELDGRPANASPRRATASRVGSLSRLSTPLSSWRFDARGFSRFDVCASFRKPMRHLRTCPLCSFKGDRHSCKRLWLAKLNSANRLRGA